ncbi:MAG: hypothetical protein JWN02_2147 [Acidobacteria bacterium]|nr:hypothetical protein [Acidobacteriota bacterium]
MKTRIVAALLLTAAFTLPTLAQAPQPAPSPAKPAETHATYEPRGLPGAGQALLTQFAGDWDVVKTFHPATGDAVSTKGTCVQRMIQGGRFLQSDFTFVDPKKGTSTGTGISGFDPKTNKFTTVWYDSNQTTMSIRQSNGTFDGKEVVLYATNLDPDRPGRKTVTRAHLEKDGQVLVHRHFLIQDDGTERLMIEFYFTRKGAAPKHK